MKKNKITLFLCALLYCSPSFSMNSDENNFQLGFKNKPSKKQVKQPIEDKPGWYSNNNKITIKYTEATEIRFSKGHKLFEGHKLYGYIDPSFSEPQWQMALDKGFTKIGKNGVKFPKNSLLKLKINDDVRLYTKEVYQNALGDYLAIFDRQARHKKMKKITNESKLTIHANAFLKTTKK